MQNVIETINGIDVEFPYQPYELQINYMKSVIRSCQTGEYALLESPTGTGKTLSLLCSVLSWKKNVNFKGHILYSTRTHSQLKNCITELKKTKFRPTISTIASRSYLCPDQKINKEYTEYQSAECRELRRNNACSFYDDKKILSTSTKLLDKIFDLDEFCEACLKEDVCPYYCAQENLKKAEIIFTPYQYIVDNSHRQILSPSIFSNSIIIFDEAHNFISNCCESFSSFIPFSFFDHIVSICEKLQMPYFGSAIQGNTTADIDSLQHTRDIFFNFSSLLTETFVFSTSSRTKAKFRISVEPYIQIHSHQLFSLFERADLNDKNRRAVISLLEQIASNIVMFRLTPFDSTVLDSILLFLHIIFPFFKPYSEIEEKYTICVTPDRKINLLCFDPSVAFSQIVGMNPHTIIMTSGTLSPLNAFSEGLEVQFPITLENPHIIDPSHLYVALASSGPTGKIMNFSFNARNDKDLRQELEICSKDLLKITPNGLLYFFPSFSFLDSYAPIFERANKCLPEIQPRGYYKHLIIEPHNSHQLQFSLDHYKSNVEDGASFLAVCRGKVSEGLDFSDKAARCVCIIGIPFPNIKDFQVELHMKWLDSRKPGSGRVWFNESASRAINQAVGRAIRHKDDWAAIIFLDARLEGMTGMLSKWVRDFLKKDLTWNDVTNQLSIFFAERLDADENNTSSSSFKLSQEPISSSSNASGNSTQQSISNESISFHDSKEKTCNEKKILFVNLPKPLENVSEIKKPIEKKINEEQFNSSLTLSQQYLVGNYSKSSQDAALHLKARLSESEQKQLILTLRNFQKTKDINLLKEALEKLSSPECKKILLDTMNKNLKKQVIQPNEQNEF